MKGVLDSWNGISIIDGALIKLAEIYTKRIVPSFFRTMTTFEENGDCEGRMASAASISFMCYGPRRSELVKFDGKAL